MINHKTYYLKALQLAYERDHITRSDYYILRREYLHG